VAKSIETDHQAAFLIVGVLCFTDKNVKRRREELLLSFWRDSSASLE